MVDATKLTPEHLDALCRMPGPTGTLYRLVKALPPDVLGPWMADEHKLGTPLHFTLTALGNYIAGVAFGAASQTTDVDDSLDSILLVMTRALELKKERSKQGGIFIPNEAEIARGGA